MDEVLWTERAETAVMLMGRAVWRRASTGDRSPRQQLRKVRDTRAREGGRERGAEGGKEEETFAVFFAAVSCLEEGKGREGSGGQREGMYVQDLNEGLTDGTGVRGRRALACAVSRVCGSLTLPPAGRRMIRSSTSMGRDRPTRSAPAGAWMTWTRCFSKACRRNDASAPRAWLR